MRSDWDGWLSERKWSQGPDEDVYDCGCSTLGCPADCDCECHIGQQSPEPGDEPDPALYDQAPSYVERYKWAKKWSLMSLSGDPPTCYCGIPWDNCTPSRCGKSNVRQVVASWKCC
jgi:hypothetical protein